MPTHENARNMRDLLGPVAAVALIAQANPKLPAPTIELTTIFTDDYDGLGVKLVLHNVPNETYDRWANLIGSSDPDSHTRNRDDRTPVRRTYGSYANTPIELMGFPLDEAA